MYFCIYFHGLLVIH